MTTDHPPYDGMNRRLIHLPTKEERTLLVYGHIRDCLFVWMKLQSRLRAVRRYDSFQGATSSMSLEMASLTVALYCRVSTDEQAQHGFSIDNQKERLLAYCKSQGWDNYRLYIDDGCTGTNLDRPALQRLLGDVHSGVINTVIVYKLDRLSRKQRDVLYLLEDEFERHHVSFRSSTEPFDTSTPLGKAMLGILAVFAQLERDTIVDRLTTGLRQRVRAGKWSGGRIPFGYTYNRTTGKLDVNRAQADLVQALFRRYLRGSSLSDLASWMASQTNERVFHHSSVRDMLERRLYIGESVFGDAFSTEIAKPIIDTATFTLVQQEIQKRKDGKLPAGEYLLTGLLRCASCNGPFIHVIRRNARGNRKTYHLYACKNQHHRPQGTLVKRCSVGYRNQAHLESWVIQQLYAARLDEDEIERQRDRQNLTTSEAKETLESLKMEVKKVELRLEKWFDAFENEAIDAAWLQHRIGKFEQQKDAIRERIAQLEEQTLEQEPNAKMQSVDHPPSLIRLAWDYMTPEEQRQVLRAAIDTIIVPAKGQNPEIIWHV